MIDVFYLLYEINVMLFKKVVEVVYVSGIFVEVELGMIGDIGNIIEGGVSEIIYIDLLIV